MYEDMTDSISSCKISKGKHALWYDYCGLLSYAFFCLGTAVYSLE